MLRCDKIVMEIGGKSTKRRKFSGNLGKLHVKFEQFLSKILSRS